MGNINEIEADGSAFEVCGVRRSTRQEKQQWTCQSERVSIFAMFGIKNGTDLYDFGKRNGIDAFSETGIRSGRYFRKIDIKPSRVNIFEKLV